MKPLILESPPPEYPAMARMVGIEGNVVLEAQVKQDGSTGELCVLRGHLMLQQAALDAAKKWRYNPYSPAGESLSVITTITVKFALSEQEYREHAARPCFSFRTSIQGQHGKIIDQVPPIDRMSPRQPLTEGSATVKAKIAKDGKVKNVQVLTGDPPAVKLVKDAVKRWRFEPYQPAGKPIEAEAEIT
ncbi:MAG: TonB family protein, partial [Terriglobales bacterium]